MAVDNEDARAIQVLLDCKDLEAEVPDKRGITPLILAVTKRQPKLIQLLIRHGADIYQEVSPSLLHLFTTSFSSKTGIEESEEEEEEEEEERKEKANSKRKRESTKEKKSNKKKQKSTPKGKKQGKEKGQGTKGEDDQKLQQKGRRRSLRAAAAATKEKIRENYQEEKQAEAREKREREDDEESHIYGTMPFSSDKVWIIDEMPHVKKRRREEEKENAAQTSSNGAKIATKRRRGQQDRSHTLLHFAAELFAKQDRRITADVFAALLCTREYVIGQYFLMDHFLFFR